LQWKANHAANGATIYAGAGPIGGLFSPTSVAVELPTTSAVSAAGSSTNQYRLAASNGTSWTDLDLTNLSLTVTPSGNCLALISANSDMWTANAGYNQDLGIDVNGTLVAWKESGGFAGTFSPNAAFVQGLAQLTSGTSNNIKLRWKTNKPAGSATIYAGAGPIAGQFSPTSLTAQVFCG
jgi:hypothetical protein